VIANGDIDTPERARDVLACTGADGIMIGRAAQGRPWIFREVTHFLATGQHLPTPTVAEAREIILAHLEDHYAFYGEDAGVRSARKHLGWYTRDLAGASEARAQFNGAKTVESQLTAVMRYFDRLHEEGERLVYRRGSCAPVTGDVFDAGDQFSARQRIGESVRAATPWVGEALAA
jgi:tRNA-dihydrouridine synthase B